MKVKVLSWNVAGLVSYMYNRGVPCDFSPGCLTVSCSWGQISMEPWVRYHFGGLKGLFERYEAGEKGTRSRRAPIYSSR